MLLKVAHIRRSLVLLSLWLGCASGSLAGLFDDEEARKAILDLRKKIEVVDQARMQDQENTQSLREENTQTRRNLLDLQNVIERLRADLSQQLGQQEQLMRDVSELQRRQRDIAQGVDDRMRRFEPVKVSIDGKDFLADPAEVKEFDSALALLRKSDFKSATQALLDFLRRYPQSGYQSLGLFWLGNAQYANREYREAIINFKSTVEVNPASSKAPEALLAIANSQFELKDTRSAQRTLEGLVKRYPQSEAAVAAQDRLNRLK